MPLLNPGDRFPRLTISATDGQTLTIPDAFAGDYGVVLFYRGAWCPYCNAQLRAFERASQTLAETGIGVGALSVDDKRESMPDADVRFYFDPVGPFAWMTSKWVRIVAAQRDYTVDWRFISLR